MRDTSNIRWLKRIPWVTYLKEGRKCDAYVNPPVSLLYGNKAPSTARSSNLEDYRCKNRAHWRYKPLKNSYLADNGTFCFQHIMVQLTSMDEWLRYNRWCTRYPEKPRIN